MKPSLVYLFPVTSYGYLGTNMTNALSFDGHAYDTVPMYVYTHTNTYGEAWEGDSSSETSFHFLYHTFHNNFLPHGDSSEYLIALQLFYSIHIVSNHGEL